MTAPPDQRIATAIRLAETGHVDEAIASLRSTAATDLSARRALATLLHRLGRNDEALRALDDAQPEMSRDPELLMLRADVLLSLGRAADAVEAARDALSMDSGRLEAQAGLGFALLQAGRWDEARTMLSAVLAAKPGALFVRSALVQGHLRHGHADEALAIARHPSVLDATPALSALLQEFAAAQAPSHHLELLRARALRHPQDYDAALALAAGHHQLGRLGDALAWCERAQALRPRERRPLEIRATALIDRGDVEAGLALYRDLLAQRDDAETAARHLVLMHYDPAQTNRRLFEALHAFAARHIPRFGPPFARARGGAEGRKRRIGWLSPRFGAGPVASFLTGLLGAFDRGRHHHCLIALQPLHDAEGRRLQTLADDWIELSGLDDMTLLQRLRALDLDVLIDLAGHSTANRLTVVAQRVAPVQVSWLDWFDTTAVPAMDAWISDAWLTPPGSTQEFSERVVRLDAGRFCFTPPPDAPSPTRAGDGAVVFSSFNRLAKLNDAVVSAWAEILTRVPGSRLQLGTQLLGDPATRTHTLERFARHGIGAERLDLAGRRPYADLLAAYRGIDIALDPFPFSGCTTTCDALFMGCAVIALPGETFVSRQSASLLQRLGREEWIARDRDDYVERAVAAAADVEVLRGGREARREEVRRRLCDAVRQARGMERVLDELMRG